MNITKALNHILLLMKPTKRMISFALASTMFMLPLLLSACDSGESSELPVADYGTYGMQTAFRFSNRYPFREAYSEDEYLSGEMIIEELETLGYEPEIQSFSVSQEDGTVKSSRNIIVRIEGSGFYSEEDLARYQERVPVQLGAETSTVKDLPALYKKQVIIGTHYDSPTTAESREQMVNFSGISDNSSGIAAILTTARALLTEETAYDVSIVFFGAGKDNAAGASAFLNSMSAEELEQTDVVYTAERLYAGDKLYAHAGHNSLLEGRKYEMRRKLYEATDVVLENNLRGTMGVDLVMNQGGYMVEVPGFEGRHVYREFTLTAADYTPFDEAGLAVVFFESAEYDVDSLAEVTESEHPAFEITGGRVSGTDFDNTYTLRTSLGTDILEDRINALAFILVQAIHKGSFSYVPAYDVELDTSPMATTESSTDSSTRSAPRS